MWFFSKIKDWLRQSNVEVKSSTEKDNIKEITKYENTKAKPSLEVNKTKVKPSPKKDSSNKVIEDEKIKSILRIV